MEYEVSYSKGIEQVNGYVLDNSLPRVVEGGTPREALKGLLGMLGELYTFHIEGESVTVTGAGDSARHVFAINPVYPVLRQMSALRYKGYDFSISVLDPPDEAYMDDAYAPSAAEVLYVEPNGKRGNPVALCQCADTDVYEHVLDKLLAEVNGSSEGNYQVRYSHGIELKALGIDRELPEFVSGATRYDAWRAVLGALEWLKTYDLTGQWFCLDSGLSEEMYNFRPSELYEAIFQLSGKVRTELDAISGDVQDSDLRPSQHVGEFNLNNGEVRIISMFWPDELLMEDIAKAGIKVLDGGDSVAER